MTMQTTGIEPGVMKLFYDGKVLLPNETTEQFKLRLLSELPWVFFNFTVKNMVEHSGHGFCLEVTLYHKDASKDWGVE